MVVPAQDTAPQGAATTVAGAVVDLLWQAGVRHAYGVCGREIARTWAALLASEATDRAITTMHMRHENGAGYAALGSWARNGRPAAVFVTTGPGVTNAITSLESARAAGAKLVLLSPVTPAGDRGRLGIQDTSAQGFRSPELYAAGRLFDLVTVLESPSELGALAGRLAAGLAQARRPFLAHIAIATTLQGAAVPAGPVLPDIRVPAAGVSPALADEIVSLLADAPFAVWAGWGARHDAPAVRRLLDVTGAPAMSSPRGLGIADRHPQFIGVTGNGGRETLLDALARTAPQRTLVLGSGLGEATSAWLAQLAPPAGFIHVDHDSGVFGRAYPTVPTLGVQADIGELLAAILARADRLVRRRPAPIAGAPAALTLVRRRDDAVHPGLLMAALQRLVVDATDIPVLADAASAMFWGARHLVFGEPGRWFAENRFGAMGNAAAAVVGVAAAAGGPALAIVGDGALHMQDEINTAVRYAIPAIWLVLNDSGLGTVRHGMRVSGYGRHDADFPQTDFAAVARAKGARGVRVDCERDIEGAVRQALDGDGPCVIDVVVDRDAAPPIGARAKAKARAAGRTRG